MSPIAICTFFGHRDCPPSIRPLLKRAVIDLIERHRVTRFYVGTHGAFDRMAASVLGELAGRYAELRCTIVLCYMPSAKEEYPLETELPTGIEFVPRRYAIDFRNKWMLQNSEYIICCVSHNWGNAAKYAAAAVHLNKTVINLAEKCPPAE